MPRRLAYLLSSVLTFATLSMTPALAQPPGGGPPTRQPFSKPGTPRQAERVRTFDVKHIKLDLKLDTKKGEVSGTVTHTMTPLHPGFDTLTLDCGADLKVSKVAAGSAPCKYEQKGNELIVTLDKAYSTDDKIDLAVTYAGTPEVGMRFVRPDTDHPNRQVCVWTQGEPVDARYWLPCYDEPNERSTAELIVTVPRPLTVVCNGVLASTHDNPDTTTTFDWKMTDQLPTYLLSITAAEFAVYHDKVGDLPVDYYVLKEVDEATARRAMGKTPRMIEFFNQKIGTPYGFAKYAQVCLPEFGGGMEHTSATTLTDSILVDALAYAERPSDSLIAHELAHQWFGDLLTCRDWSNLWLNEGFASYFDPLYFEHAEGPDAFQMAMNSDKQGYLGSDRQYRRPIVEAKYNDPFQMFDGVTYSKGACVLHALRGTVGDDAWWKGIQLYVARNKDKTVETADFRKAMEEASGKDLGWFFDQWVFKAGHPELTAKWHFEDADKTVRLKVEQTQPTDDVTPLFRLPTTVEITDDAGTRSIPIVIDARTQEFVIPASGKPKMVLIDPKGWLPKVLTFEKPTDELAYQLEHAPTVLARIDAAQALATGHKAEQPAIEALLKAWSKEKYAPARALMVGQVAALGEPGRAALIEASKDTDARVKVAAATGLGTLKFDPALEAIDRALWTDKTAPYGARRAALNALVAAKVKDADDLLDAALADPANNHTFAQSALRTVLNRGNQKSREAAVYYSRPGQPLPLRAAAIQTLGAQSKDDPQAAKMLIGLLDDPATQIQTATGFAIASAGITSALPKLEQQLTKLSGRAKERLAPQVEALKKKAEPATPATDTASLKEATDLERQATELDLQARELRNKAEALKIKADKAKQTPKAGL